MATPGGVVIDTLIVELLYKTNVKALAAFESGLDRVSKRLRDLAVRRLATGLSVLGGFGAAAKAGVEWETSFTGVKKTVDATDEEIKELEEDLRNLARQRVPIPHEDIASIAETAGQVSVATHRIEGFVGVMSDLEASTDITATNAAAMTSEFARIVRMDPTKFGNLASVIVDLGNSIAPSELQFTNMAIRMAGVGKTIDLTESEILGFAATLSSVGLEEQLGASSISQVWSDMQAAVQGGTEELTSFARVAGVSRDEFRYLFGRDAAQATIAFVQGLKRMVDQGEDVHKVLADLGFGAVGTRDTLLRLAGVSDRIGGILDQSATAWKEDTARVVEAGLRYETVARLLQFVKNSLRDLRIEVWKIIEPRVVPVIDRMREWINWARDWVREHPRLINLFYDFGIAITTVSSAMLGLSFVLGGMSAVIGVVGGALLWMIGLLLFAIKIYKVWWILHNLGLIGIVRWAKGVIAAYAAMVVAASGYTSTLGRVWYLTLLGIQNYFVAMRNIAVAIFLQILAAGRWAAGMTARAFIVNMILNIVGGMFILGRTAIAIFRTMQAGFQVMIWGMRVALMKTLTVMTGGLFWVFLALGVIVIALLKSISTFFVGMWRGFQENFHKIKGAWSDLMDALGPVGGPIRRWFDWMFTVVKWLIGLFGDWEETGRAWGETMVSSIVWVIEKLTELIDLLAFVPRKFLSGIAQLGELQGGALGDPRNLAKQGESLVGGQGEAQVTGGAEGESLVGGQGEAQVTGGAGSDLLASEKVTPSVGGLVQFLGILSRLRVLLFGTGALLSKVLGPAVAVYLWPLLSIAGLILLAWRPVSTFFKGFAEGFRSTFDRIGNATDGFVSALGRMGRAFASIFGLGDWLSWIVGLFGDWTDVGVRWGVTFGNSIVWVIEKLTDLVSFVGDKFAWLADFFHGPELAYASGFYHNPPTAAIKGPGTRVNNRRTDVRIDRIDINVPSGDPELIALGLQNRLSEILRSTAEDFDDDFAR